MKGLAALFIAVMPIASNAETTNTASTKETVTQTNEPDTPLYNKGIDGTQQQETLPFDYPSLKNRIIQQVIRGKADGFKVNIVLTGLPSDGAGNKNVRQVFFITDGEYSDYPDVEPATIKELVYHDLGPDEYLEVITQKPVYDYKGRFRHIYRPGYYLDKETAQFLLDLTSNSTQWNDLTGIKFSETKESRRIRLDFPFRYRSLSSKIVQQLVRGKANYKDVNIVFTGFYGDGRGRNNKTVRWVYFIKDDEYSNGEFVEPNHISEIVYHDLGKDAYVEAIVKHPVYDSEQHFKGYVQQGFRLDDESAQQLLDLTSKSGKWTDKTGIKYRETQNPNLSPVI